MKSLPFSQIPIPQDTDSSGWGDSIGGLTSEDDGFFYQLDIALNRLFADPTNYESSALKIQQILNQGASGAEYTQIYNLAQFIIKSLFSSDGSINIVDSGNAIDITSDGGLPSFTVDDAGKKLVVNQTGDDTEWVASTTTSGFVDRDTVDLSFDDGTRTLTLTATAADYSYIYNGGVEETKTTDSIQISDVSGLHGVYYNNTTGVLEAVPPGVERIDIINKMEVDIPVSYIQWNSTEQMGKFVTDVKKGRGMGGTVWAKNAYDRSLYVLQGCVYNNDPSDGGTTTPPSNLDTSAQFGIDDGWVLWTDGKYNTPQRNVGDDWEVYYKDGSDIASVVKTDFAVLNDTDFATTTSGAVVYNNDGVPTRVNDNDYVWYLVAVSNDVSTSRRLVSFMGQNQYTTLNNARDGLFSEITDIESSFSIRQEFSSIYAILYQTNDSWVNTAKARIVDFYVITSTGDPLPVGGGSNPFNPANSFFVAEGGTTYQTPQSALDAAGSVATVDNYQSVYVFAGTYAGDVSIPEYVNLIGFDPSKCIINGTCLLDHQGTTQDVEIRGIRFKPSTVTDNENIVRITSDGSLTFIDNIIEVENYGDIGFTGIKIEGNATLKARDNQITTLKTTSDNGGRDIYGIRADNISNVNDITVQNAFTISHTSADINDNFYGVYVGGASPTHFSNFLFLANLTNASYSGNIKVISYPSDTTTKTFGDLTVRVNDAGVGNLDVIDIDSTSGLFQGSNLNLEYNGGGTAVIANVNTGAELHASSYCATGFTSINIGSGYFHAFGLFNDILNSSVDVEVDGEIEADKLTITNNVSHIETYVDANVAQLYLGGSNIDSDHFLISYGTTATGSEGKFGYKNNFLNGSHSWFTNDAGTESEKMTLLANGELMVANDITQKGTTLDNTYSPIAVEIPKGSATSANVIKFLSIETTADILNGSVTSGFYGKINLLMDYWNSQNIGYTPLKSEVATSLGIQYLDANSFNIVNYTSNVGGSGIQARVTITNSQITNGGTKATRSYGLYGTGIDIQYNKTSDSIIKFEFGVLVQNTLDWDIEPTFKVTNIQKFDSTIVDYTQSATSNVDWDDIV